MIEKLDAAKLKNEPAGVTIFVLYAKLNELIDAYNSHTHDFEKDNGLTVDSRLKLMPPKSERQDK